MNGMNQGRGGMKNVKFETREQLYHSYMPFIKNGGIFIPTAEACSIGDEMFLVISLPDDREKTPSAVRVVWVTPKEADGNKQPGIGVQFKDKGVVRSKIENILAGALKSESPTYTM